MEESFDLFGEALMAYLHGDRNEFYFEDKQGKKYEQSLPGYFDKNRPFTKLEGKIISLSGGRILDLGCGAGGFMPSLMKKGEVHGIDISPNMIRICKDRGLKNVEVADIFKFRSKVKFDTIVLLDENLGFGGTIENTKKLLEKLSNLLSAHGQILANGGDVEKDYLIREFRAVWKRKHGPWFKWMKFNSRFLVKLCGEQGLKAEIIERDRSRYAVKITHS
ncbi:MAG: methyltransferase domain-containing protein [Candidatus Aenigmatarchaeota archaeon]